MSLNIIDVAHDQALINLSQVRAPVDGAIIGWSDGSYLNPVAHSQYAQAKALGWVRGAYHYFEGDAAAEAQFFVANAPEVIGDGTVWCDAETFFPDLPARTLAWLTAYEQLTGIRAAGFYTSYDFLTSRGLDWSPLYNADYGLWESAYVLGYQPVQAFNIPGGRAAIPWWGTPAMWQYTSSGILPGWTGGAVDFSTFAGDRTAWQAYVGTVNATGTTITPITPVAPAAPPAVPAPGATLAQINDWISSLSTDAYTQLIEDIAHRVWGYSGDVDHSGLPVTMWARVAMTGPKNLLQGQFSDGYNGTVALADRLTGIDNALNSPASALHKAILAKTTVTVPAPVVNLPAPVVNLPAPVVNQPPVDVAGLAAALAPLLAPAAPGALTTLSADELAALAKAVNDEADARERARLTPPTA